MTNSAGNTVKRTVGSTSGKSTAVEVPEEFDNWNDVIDWMEERKAAIHLPTKEDLEKERRRHRTQNIISGLADTASAFSNLFFTTKDAPNMYDASQSLSAKMRERQDRLKAERAANEDKYLNLSTSIAKMRDARDQLKQKMTYAKEAHQWKKDEAEHKAKLRPYEITVAQNKQEESGIDVETATHRRNKAESDSETAKVKSEYAAQQEVKDLEVKGSTVSRNNAAAFNQRSQGRAATKRANAAVTSANKKGPKDYEETTVVVEKGGTKTTTRSRTYGKKKPVAKPANKKDMGIKWKNSTKK